MQGQILIMLQGEMNLSGKLGLLLFCCALLTFAIETMLARVAVSIQGNSGGWMEKMTWPSILFPAIVLVIGYLLMRIEE